jgi:hypothetical protein
MASILPIPDTCEKNERGYCSSSRYGEKPLSISQKFLLVFPESSLEDRWSNREKMVLIFGESGFGGG